MKNIGLERLRKLAKHLTKGKLGHEKFSFGYWNDATGPRCGTLGCAVGECPIRFPRQWKWGRRGDPVLRKGSRKTPHDSAEKFFGIIKEEAEHLFIPQSQFP